MTDSVDTRALAAWRVAAAHVNRHELAEAEALLSPYADRPDLAPATAARIGLEWSWLMAARGRHAQAAAGYRRVVEYAEPEALWELRTEALLEAGILARQRGYWDEAEGLLTEAATLAARHGSFLRAGQCLAQQVAVAHLRYRFLDARELLAELASVVDRCPPSEQTEQLRAGLSHQGAVSARIARDFDRARHLLQDARDRYAALGRRIGTANVDLELGAVLDQLGDAPGARRAYERAFVSYLRSGRRIGAAHASRRLGQMRLLSVPEEHGAAAYVRRRLEQALRLGGEEPGNRLLCGLFLARLDRLTGDPDAAEAALTDLVGTIDGSVAARDLSQLVLETAMIARDRGDRAATIELLGQALLPLDADHDPSAASIVHYHLAVNLILDDREAPALEHAVTAFRLAEEAGRRLGLPEDREMFYRDQRQAYIMAMHCAARAGDGATAFTVATAARAEAMSAFVRSGASFSDELRQLVDAATLARGTPRHEELLRRLERATTTEMRRAVTPAAAGLGETLDALPPGGHALIVDVLEDEDTICSRVWLPPGGRPVVDELILPEAVRRRLDRYHAAEAGLAAALQETELAELGAAVIPPGLADALISGSAPALVLSTGGLLGPVPVAAIRVGSRYLAELTRLVVVPAITLWTSIRARPPADGRGVVAYLDPDLPGAHRERSRLEQAFPEVVLPSRAEIRPMLATVADRAAVVFSVHGTATAGLGQALELARDDPLTAAELLTHRLPEAVLMPACWAGRTHQRAADEPLGLPTTALLAGARWVLAGTVDISGSSTAGLLGAFYQRLAAGEAPVDALRETQIDYLRTRGPVAPGLWAGLTIVGDGFGRGAV